MVLGIYGAGGFGREVRETAAELGLWDEIIYIDDYTNSDILDGSRRLSFADFCREFTPDKAKVVCALGDPGKKSVVCKRITSSGYEFDNVIHSRCEISSSATLGTGIILRSGVVISVGVTLCDNCAVMENTYIGHGSLIGKGVHISPNVSIGGDVTICEESFVGSNACIKERLTVGRQSVIGLGAIALSDIEPNTVFFNRLSNVAKTNDLKSIF